MGEIGREYRERYHGPEREPKVTHVGQPWEWRRGVQDQLVPWRNRLAHRRKQASPSKPAPGDPELTGRRPGGQRAVDRCQQKDRALVKLRKRTIHVTQDVTAEREQNE
jgi:hypothetical protein